MIDILLTKEAAKLLRVSEEFVRKLIRQKKLKAYKEGRRGGYRILGEDVNGYIKVRLHNAAKTLPLTVLISGVIVIAGWMPI